MNNYILKGNEVLHLPKNAHRSAHFCVSPETKLDFLRKAVRMAIMGKYSHLIIEFWGTLKWTVLLCLVGKMLMKRPKSRL